MAYDNRDPAYVPSQQALAADAYIASTSPETHPDEYTYYPGYGNTYTGPMANYTSGTEYNTWLNSSLFGGSMFGSGQEVANFYNDSSDLENVETLLNAFPNAQDTATYLPETNFPGLNADSANATVNTTGSTSTTTSNANEELTANGQCEGNDFVVTYSDGRVERVPNYGYCLNGELLDSPVDHSASSTVNTNNTATTVPWYTFEGDALDSSTFNVDTNSNSSNAGVLTAAGLASALSMLIPQPEPTPTGVMGPSSGGSFNPAPIQGLNFSSPELAPIGSSNKIDYVKQIRAGLFKDLV